VKGEPYRVTDSDKRPPSIRHYYVDESGDGVLFNRKGQVIIGTEGCMNHFILGLLDVVDPVKLHNGFQRLRAGFLADPYFRKVPSMQPQAGKTALAFHARNDVPEVRREVFRLLLKHEVRFFAVVKTMRQVLDYVTSRNHMHPTYRYHPNELYDLTVRMLFKARLHKHDQYRIHFAQRGKSDRTQALYKALRTTRDRFQRKWNIDAQPDIEVIRCQLREQAGLQAVDYFLWSLQRLYERREDRYLEYLWPRISLVHDVDDTRQAPYGVYYTKKRPLSLAALEEPGI